MLGKKCLILMLATLVMSEVARKDEKIVSNQIKQSEQPHSRQPRAALKSLGFFGKIAYMGGLLFQQYNDTSHAFNQIKVILNDQFSDTVTKKPKGKAQQTTSEPGETTTEAYRISRAEFGKIINRNLRGLQKLFKIELADANNQSYYTKQEYKKQLYDQLKPKGGTLQKRLNLTVSNSL